MAADQFHSTDIFISTGSVPHDNALVFSERLIPGSSTTYIDIAGQSLGRISLDLFFLNDTAYRAIQALVGSTGALNTTTFGNFSAALLVRLSQGEVAPLGQRRATAEFIIT